MKRIIQKKNGRNYQRNERKNGITEKVSFDDIQNHTQKTLKENEKEEEEALKEIQEDTPTEKKGGSRKIKKQKQHKRKKWSNKYKRSIDCKHPKGFSQKQYCKYGRKKTRKRK